MDRKWWVLSAIGVGTFMSALDGSVVNTILPVVRSAFGASVEAIQWVVTVYLLVVSGLLLSVGRLGDLRGHKPVYLSGFVGFVIGSMLCGLASSEWILIASRGLQALGAAMLFANSPAILTKTFPPEQRGQALGLQATMTYLGLTVGPSLGGWLATRLGWPSVFYINVPVGGLAIFLSMRYIPNDAGETHQSESFDIVGALTFMAGLVILLFGLNQGQARGWTSPVILSLLTGAVALLAVFIFIERRAASPMLDLSLFRRRIFSASAATAVLNYICINSVTFLLPFYLIQGRGLNAAQAGLILTAQPIVMAISAPLSGTLSDRVGSRVLSTLGMAILGIGLFLLSRLTPDSPLSQVAASLVVTGLGTGVFISPNTSALMGAAPRHRQGIASGILATARNVGMVLGVGLAGAVLATVQAQRQASAALATVQAQQQASGSSTPFFDGISAGFLVAAGVAVLGVMTSVVRGRAVSGEQSG